MYADPRRKFETALDQRECKQWMERDCQPALQMRVKAPIGGDHLIAVKDEFAVFGHIAVEQLPYSQFQVLRQTRNSFRELKQAGRMALSAWFFCIFPANPGATYFSCLRNRVLFDSKYHGIRLRLRARCDAGSTLFAPLITGIRNG